MAVISGAPKLKVTEIDKSLRVPSQIGSTGAIVVEAEKGPTDQPMLITSTTQFMDIFSLDGKTKFGTDNSVYSALSFLSRSNKLWVIRAVSDSTLYGGAVFKDPGTAPAPLTTGFSDPDAYTFASDDVFLLYGANEGAWNNKVGVRLTKYDDNPDKVKVPGAILIEVFIKPHEYDPVETFVVSRVRGAKDGYGRNIYIEDALKASNYIRAADNVTKDSSIVPDSTSSIVWFGGGDDGTSPTDGDFIRQYDHFRNKATYPLGLLLDGGFATPPVQLNLIDIAEKRMDSVAILSTPFEAEASANYVNALVDYRQNQLNANSSYAGLFTSHVKIYDKDIDAEIYISPDGFVAGTIAYVMETFEPWYPAAGWRRGVLNVLGLHRVFSEGEMDVLYDKGINPIKKDPVRGKAIWGQKTLYTLPSALDRLYVRLLLNYLETNLATVLEGFIFELNDEITRAAITSLVDSFMASVKARRGVYDYAVVCDESNNTPWVIDNYNLIVDVYVQPVKAAEYINLRMIVTRTGVNFSNVQI